MRVKRGIKARRRRNRILKLSSGFRGRSNNTIRQATQRAEKSLQYAYRDRKARKHEFRRLWIQRISGALSATGLSYSRFIAGLKNANVELDRKILADIGMQEPEAFKRIAETAQASLSQ